MKYDYIETDEDWTNLLHSHDEKKISKYQINSENYSDELDWIVQEIPVALVYNGVAYAVMMMLPQDLEYFAIGFSVSEGVVENPLQIKDIEVNVTELGVLLEIEISSKTEMQLKAKRKSMVGRTGCGLCGSAFLEQVFLKLTPQPITQIFAIKHIKRALSELLAHQPIGQKTSCTHIVAWVSHSGEIIKAFEDVGRHIALDKLMGYCLKHKLQDGVLLLSSRASYEMVQKAARCGVEIIFAISAVTGLAIETAKKANITLVGFAKNQKISIYSGKQRIT